MKKRHLLKKAKNEKGQALVEFVLVLPLFALILMGIIDFGWLFYNYIGVENSARDAARIACVEYSDMNYDETNKRPYASQTFNFDYYNSYAENPAYKKTRYDSTGAPFIVNEVTDVLDAAMAGVTSSDSVELKTITVAYSYDEEAVKNGDFTDYIIQNRSRGDVTVTVHATMRVLTPVLAPFSDHMNLNLTSKSTYKVEVLPADD